MTSRSIEAMEKRRARVSRKLAEHKAACFDELLAAVRSSVIALDDWLNIHAEDFCGGSRVAEAKRRIGERGTVAYIAEIQRINRAAIAHAEKRS